MPLLKEQLERGELRPIFLYDKVRTRKVGEEEIRRFDSEGLSFFNMNAPDDYAQALMLWQQRENFMESTEDAPLSCTVELFGVARLLAKTQVISLSLPETPLSLMSCRLLRRDYRYWSAVSSIRTGRVCLPGSLAISTASILCAILTPRFAGRIKSLFSLPMPEDKLQPAKHT